MPRARSTSASVRWPVTMTRWTSASSTGFRPARRARSCTRHSCACRCAGDQRTSWRWPSGRVRPSPLTATTSARSAENLEGGRVSRDVHRFADAALQHVGPDPEAVCGSGRRAKGWPGRRPRTGMVTHEQRVEARRLHSPGQSYPATQAPRLSWMLTRTPTTRTACGPMPSTAPVSLPAQRKPTDSGQGGGSVPGGAGCATMSASW